MLVLKLPRQAGAPTNAAVSAGHIRNRGAGFGGFEPVRLRHHVGDLIAAPTVTLYADVVLIDKAPVDDGLHRRQDALQRVTAGIAGLVNNIGYEDQIPVTDVIGWVDRCAG